MVRSLSFGSYTNDFFLQMEINLAKILLYPN